MQPATDGAILLLLGRRRSLGSGSSGGLGAGGGGSSLGASSALRARGRGRSSAGGRSSARCAGDGTLGGFFFLSLRQRHLAMRDLRQAQRALAVVPLLFVLELVQTLASRQHVAMTNQCVCT